MSSKPLSLAFTGHMVDLPGRSPPRFPPEVVDAAGIEIERRIGRHTEGRSKTGVKGFASLARGGDIFFHEICRNFGFDTVIVLPFSPDLFLKTSVEVTGGGGDWPQRFHKLWDAITRIAALSADQAPTAIIGCSDMTSDPIPAS
jgi:hypothetical protein